MRLALGFEVAAGEDEHGDRAGDLEVELVLAGAAFEGEAERHLHAGHAGGAPEQGVDAPAERGERADGDEGVHRRRAVTEVHPGGSVERPGAPQDDRPGHREGEPLPVVELQRVDHRQQQHRDAEQRGADQPVRSARVGCVLGFGVVPRSLSGVGVELRAGSFGRVADRFDLADEVVDVTAVGEGDGGLFGGVVDAGFDAVELVEPFGDPGGARGAGHAADVEGDGVRRGVVVVW